MLKVCIYGVGAIGGFIGTRLALGGECDVSAVARGATLAALQAHGLRLQQGGAQLSAPVRASDDPAKLGVQDLVLIAVKSPALAEVAERIAPLIGPHTMLLPAMNGVPWWFGAGAPALGDAPLHSIDAGGRIASALPLAAVIGCVVHASTSTSAPGQVQHQRGQGLILGEPLGGVSPRVQRLVGLLARAFCTAAMAEAAAVGARIGCQIDQTPQDRHQITRKLGAFKTSMLQDVLAGRLIELDALVTVVREIAQRVGVATPFIDALLGLARLHGQSHGLYPALDSTP